MRTASRWLPTGWRNWWCACWSSGCAGCWWCRRRRRGDRGQTLDVTAEDPRDRLGLGLAQLGELVGDVRDGAVLLAQLLAHRALADRGGEPRLAHGRGQGPGRGLVGVLGEELVDPGLEDGPATPGELGDGLVAGGLGQEAQGLGGQVVVLLLEEVVTGGGEREDLGRATASAGASLVRARLAQLDQTVLEHVVEVATYGGRGQQQLLSEDRRAARTTLEDGPRDALARRRVGADVEGVVDFHNTSVPLLLRPLQ